MLAVLVGLLFACIPPIASSSDSPQQAPRVEKVLPSTSNAPEKIAAIESDIRSTDFNRRQQAMLRLWGGRESYREWVEKAVNDTDPEVAKRAAWVLDRWRRGLLPDTPRDIAARLEGVSGPDTIENLLNAGLFTGALVAIDEAIGGATSPAIIDRAESAVRRRFPFFVRMAAQRNELPQFVSILDRLADDASMTLSFHQLNQLVNGVNQIELPSASQRWTATQRKRIAVILHAAQGDLPKAVELAEAAKDIELIRVCRMLAGDWHRMANEQAELARAQAPDSVAWYRHWMYALMAASRVPHTELPEVGSIAEKVDATQPENAAVIHEAIRKEAVQRLSEPRRDGLDADAFDPINRIRWQSLAMHGYLDEASAILKKLQPADAAELLAQAGRHPAGFAALGVDYRDLDSALPELVEDAVKGERNQAINSTDQGSPELAKLLTVVRLLVHVGRDDLALQSLKAVVNAPSLANQDYSAITRVQIMRTLARVNRNEWVGSLLVSPNESTLPGRTQFFLAMVFDAENETVSTLLEAISRLRPQNSYGNHVRDTIALLSGTLPEGFDADKDFRLMFQSMASNRLGNGANGPGILLARGQRLSIDIARIFELHNQPELAKQVLIELARSGDDAAKLKLALSELNEGNVSVARQAFDAVWNSTDVSGRELTRINQSDTDSLVAMKAIHGESVAAKRLGDNEGAEQLDALIQMMSCTPSATLRNSFAEYLVEQGRLEQAEAIYRPLLQLVAFGSEESVEFYTIARNFDAAVSESSPSASAAALDLAIAGTIETTVFYPAAYVSLPSYVHRRMIRNAVREKDVPEIKREVDRLLALDPMDIDFGEKVLESMREQGLQELANDILERIYQAGNEHLQNFPLDRGMANNLAWVMALSDFRLNEALAFSKRAVYYEPDSTVYRDTLAEILFRLGRTDEAIAIERACLLDDPSEWHVHEQIRRFESGDRSSTPGQTIP